MNTIYDLVVIGGGSGGVRAARIAASLGARVAIIEDTHWGGTCVNVGCVPKKMYHYAASIAKQIKLGKAYGWDISTNSIDWQAFHEAKNTEISRLQGIYAKMLNSAGCTVIQGFGQITNAAGKIKTVTVGEQLLQTKRILLAVGCTPAMPDIKGIEHCLNSDELFYLNHLPKKLLVVGGGYIGCEMASIYHHLGAEVTLTVRSKLLRGFDEETTRFLQNELENDGLNVQTGRVPCSFAKRADGAICVYFDDGGNAEYDAVLIAAGRKPRFDGLGLDAATVELDDAGLIKVDDNFQTQHQGIYAVGDIIAGPELTPVALEQGMYLARLLFGGGASANTTPIRPNFAQVATAVFTHPQMATVGMTEEQVVAQGIKADIYTSSFRHLKYTITSLQQRSFIKLIVARVSDKILGIHMVGEEVGEIMQGFAALITAGGTKAQLDATIGIHPTVAEELVTMREVTRTVGG